MKSVLAALFLAFAAAGNGASAAEFSDAELVNLGQSYAQAINQLDAEALTALFSPQHLARKIADIAGDSADEKQEYFRGFRDGLPSIVESILVELKRQQAKAVFLRIHELDGMHGPLVRYSVGSGYNYALLLPVPAARTKAGARIGDIYVATSGELFSETLGIATKLMTSPSETFLGKLFGVTEVDGDLVARFEKIARLRQQNKLQEAFDALDQVPGNMRNQRLVLMNTIQIASQLDETLYRQELHRLAKHHENDPRVAFTLLDHYFYESEWDSATSIIDLIEQAYGKDAVTLIFRTSVESSRGRLDTALGFARKAAQLEPANEPAQWTLLKVLVDSGMFGEGVEVLQLLEREFGYAFTRDDFKAEPTYNDFVKSKDFEQWIETP